MLLARAHAGLVVHAILRRLEGQLELRLELGVDVGCRGRRALVLVLALGGGGGGGLCGGGPRGSGEGRLGARVEHVVQRRQDGARLDVNGRGGRVPELLAVDAAVVAAAVAVLLVLVAVEHVDAAAVVDVLAAAGRNDELGAAAVRRR